MMSRINPSEEQTGLKAKKSWKSLYDERMASLQTDGLSSSYDHQEISHPDVDFTPCPRNDMSRKVLSTSPTITISDGITVGVSSTFDKLMMSMGKQARVDQAQLVRNTDQCLTESYAQATKESEEREVRMIREIDRMLNDHDNNYAHTMTSLEKRMDAKSDLMMRTLDEVLNGGNRDERSAPKEHSRQANDGDGARSYAGAQQSSRTRYESKPRERPRAAPLRPGWTNSVLPEADATPETRLPTVPQIRSVPDPTTTSQETTMYASMFEPLNRSLEAFITKLSKSTER